ncbi:hypothetical protein BV95_02367 [Sphingobium chlorophenolicum]|uniref:GIY-YIG domain-containing protein n=1 Tax=Sphingobium chlorophenolicum TaxID=46429 RepID=A0A081RDT7_SPHCR|nr:hypothetical protein BV95_02367 [Sphingobium chlorophenolicum]
MTERRSWTYIMTYIMTDKPHGVLYVGVTSSLAIRSGGICSTLSCGGLRSQPSLG